MTRGEVLSLQSERLRATVRYAAERISHYVDSFQAHGVSANDIRSIDDLHRLPILERKVLQATPTRLRDSFVLGTTPERSSGSSGSPIEVHFSQEERLHYLFVRSRTYQQMGAPLGDIAYVGLDKREPAERTPYARLDGSGAMHILECRRPIQEIHDELLRLRPAMLTGFTGALLELARFMRRRGTNGYHPSFVAPGGEVLSPEARAELESTFQAPVRATYACTEAFWLGGDCSRAAENGCPHYHLNDDAVVVEVVNENGLPVDPGQRGRILLTTLATTTQPLIRYAIGDLGVAGDAPSTGPQGCACGSPFSTLAEVTGRELDYLISSSGQPVHAYNLSIRIRDAVPGLNQYRIDQQSGDTLVLELVGDRPLTDETRARLQVIVTEVLGPGVHPSIIERDELGREPNGKFRVVRSAAYAEWQAARRLD